MLRYRAGSSDVVFTSGKTPRGARSVTIDFANGWSAQTFGAPVHGAALAKGSAMALLLAGIALSLLLGLLVFVLGTGRARALKLVSRKTDELRHQALHDTLTGLPNRALIMDRIDPRPRPAR
jgi:hypothetical protein